MRNQDDDYVASAIVGELDYHVLDERQFLRETPIGLLIGFPSNRMWGKQTNCEVLNLGDRIKRLDTAKKCEVFARNALERGRFDAESEAQDRAMKIPAEVRIVKTQAEYEASHAVYTYEEFLI